MTRILGIAASLRNARWGRGNEALVEELKGCRTEDELKQHLTREADLHLGQFLEAGRAEGKDFQQIYRGLKQLSGNRGLSNSEVALSASLWAAHQRGAEIEHVSLSEHFPAGGKARRREELVAKLRAADGIIISGPVYFGDRGSLTQDLVDLIRDDADLRRAMIDKVYAGVAVGAKRNGGQETTLIYQLLDLVELGMAGVGNDSETTAQYGGTCHAGDVGTMPNDHYGLWTSMGAGRRAAHVARLMGLGARAKLAGPVRVQFWILQDREHAARDFAVRLAETCRRKIEVSVIDATAGKVTRCIACDVCPTHIALDDEYRCIIQGGNDFFGSVHRDLLHQDAIVPVYYGTADRSKLISNYQRFIERTRYLRRGDYVFSDALVAPLVIRELDVEENMHVRMLTSMVRHNTVVSRPMLAYLNGGECLNELAVHRQFAEFVRAAEVLTAGRLQSILDAEAAELTKYNPVGYVLSTEKDKEDEKLRVRRQMIDDRNFRAAEDARRRLVARRKEAA